jgi:hypothetical protein
MAWFAASLLLPWLAAYVLVGCCDRAARHDGAALLLHASLAMGIGVGLSSCGYFLWMFLAGPPGTFYHACDLTVFAAISLAGLFFRPAATTADNPSELPFAAGLRWQRFLLAAFVAALMLAVLGAVGVYWKDPMGDWDAWAIWNQRARFLFRAGDQWQQALSPIFFHPDYPLLLPSSNARLWSYLGAEATWAPWLLGVLFTFATLGVLTAGLWRLRSRSQGLLAGLVLLGMVPFLQRGAWQYADVPLAFFILAAVLLLILYDAAERPRAGLLLLCALMAGLAAWTKNEGLLLPIALPAARAVVLWRRRCLRRAPRELLYWMVGIAPVLAMVAIQKLCLTGDNDLVSNQTWQASLRQLIDVSRYWQVTQALVLYTLRIARPFAVVLPLCLLFLGRARNGAVDRRGLPVAIIVLVLQLASYFLAYLLTPWDLHWHLTSSADRLLLHLCPLGLFILFLWFATPEEVFAEEAEKRLRSDEGDLGHPS